MATELAQALTASFTESLVGFYFLAMAILALGYRVLSGRDS